MTWPHEDFDPDDNFAGGPEGAEIDDEAGADALVWQLLLVINPGDEDAALQQFGAFQEALDGGDAGDVDAVWLLTDVIDWKSGFHIEETEPDVGRAHVTTPVTNPLLVLRLLLQQKTL